MRKLLVAFAATFAITTLSAAPLKMGDDAPSLKGIVWVKNGPVSIEDGKNKKVYIVEFWATWCPPCRVSIPHLSGLQKKYKSKGLVVVGISNEPFGIVKKFVEAQKDMNYNVAIDEKGAVYSAYMSGEKGIPIAFIIGKNGKVLWKGHPLQFDSVLEKVLAGSFDGAAQKRVSELSGELRQAMQGQDMRKVSEVAMRILEIDPENEMAMQVVLYGFREDIKKALDFLSALMDRHPDAYAPYINTLKILTAKKDGAALRVLIVRYKENFNDDPSKLNTMAWWILDKAAFGIQPLDIALGLAESAVKLASKGNDKMLLAAYYDTLARSQYALGRLDLAIESQKRAVELVSGTKERPLLMKTLDFYKKTKALGEKLAK
ncbi:MAG: redoxin domain-containing protein [Kiritimatiellaeota bacterium]|nr:redoxin domain-containing protein [Kiritimatiellota bacterium]